jgi:hypothetical protein
MNCPHCKHELSEPELKALWAEHCGKQSSAAKARASAANGRKGGRPVTYFQNLYDFVPESIENFGPYLKRMNYQHTYPVERIECDDPTEKGFFIKCTDDVVWHCRWNQKTNSVEVFQGGRPVTGYNTVNNSARTAAERLVKDIHIHKLMSMPEDNSDIVRWIEKQKRK